MRGYRVRIHLGPAQWIDTVIYADTWFNARTLAEGQSPIGRADYLGEAV